MKYPNFIKNQVILLFITLLPISAVLASNQPAAKGIFEVLGYKQVVNIQLSFDQDAVLNDRRSDTEYPGTLQFKDETGATQNWDIKLNVRGKFRRAKCNEMPPLKLNFKKKDLEAAGLAPFDDFKLVTYCLDDYVTAKELLLKEYLAYKMYNQITEASFRVQLLNITYIDTKTGDKKRQIGFLIEDTAQLRARIGAEKTDLIRVIEAERFHQEFVQKAALFEYLIGNADWEITYSKNVKYVSKDNFLIPIPYDFDFSALVGAPYATYFSNNYGQTSLYDRVYLGFERSSTDLEATLGLFTEKKEALYQVIQNFKLLNADTRTEMITYLDTFFENRDGLKFPTKDTVSMPGE